MSDYSNQCLTCKYWKGNKYRQYEAIKSNRIAMDLAAGWPEEGPCDIQHRWTHVVISGNATADLEVDANFGCIHHEPDNPQ